MSIPLKAGLKFRSNHFTADAEILRIDEKANTIEVKLTPSDGNAWVEKDWNLQHVQWAFEKGEYYIPKIIKDEVTTS